VHGFPFFCLLVDFIFNVYQFPLRHLSAVLTVAFGYLIINLSNINMSKLTLSKRPPSMFLSTGNPQEVMCGWFWH